MQLNRLQLLFLLSLFAFVLWTGNVIAQQQDTKKNKLVEFQGFGEWEIWCIDIAQSGSVQCNLNQVLRYKNHPDFRAMIPRFYANGERISRMVFDREWQTSFAKAFIQVDEFEPSSLSDCERPCVIEGKLLSQIVDQFSKGEKATIQFHDYLVEKFDVEISLENFTQALQALKQMQAKY